MRDVTIAVGGNLWVNGYRRYPYITEQASSLRTVRRRVHRLGDRVEGEMVRMLRMAMFPELFEW